MTNLGSRSHCGVSAITWRLKDRARWSPSFEVTDGLVDEFLRFLFDASMNNSRRRDFAGTD